MAAYPHFFIGISLNRELNKEISEWQSFLKKELESNYRIWTHPEDFHLTLKFIGEVKPDQLAVLQKKLETLKDFPPFWLTFKGVGTFGKPRKPRVLWVGVEENAALHDLKEKVEEKCKEAGFMEDTRPYRPHVTLAKKWKGEKLSTEKLAPFAEELNEEKEMKVSSVSLFQVHPTEQPKYEEVMKIEWK